MKRIRNTLNAKMTYADREQDNWKILGDLQEAIIKQAEEGKDEKRVKMYSQVYEERKTKLMQRIIMAEEETLEKATTLKKGTITPINIEDNTWTKLVETALENLSK